MRSLADITDMAHRPPEYKWDTKSHRDLTVDIYSQHSFRDGATLKINRDQAMDLWLVLGEALTEAGKLGGPQGPVPAEAAVDAPTNGTHAAEVAAGSFSGPFTEKLP